jgi:2-hydroxycyclohexanecarboxyl-CoA dehydrogenase
MGQVAIVTGATSEIGAAAARELARRGHAVGVHFHRHEERAAALVEELTAGDGEAVAFGADVAEEAEVERGFADVRDALGPIAVLVNVAALVRFERFMESSAEDRRAQVAATLLGTMNCCRVAAEDMRDAGEGRIVSVVAEGALVGEPALAVASAAKAGVVGLTRSLALELAGEGITVNSVSPGFVPTDAVPARFREPDRLERIARRYPAGRLGTPADIAAAIGFLCSPEASYVTGQTLSVSGGYSVR